MRLRAFCAFVSVVGFCAFATCQPAVRVAVGEVPSGMVWEKHGEWHLNGSAAELRLGEAIPSGGLLTAGAQSAPHSATILLPDGQRLLCECYDAKACSQGFRIPVITPLPSAAVWDMFVQVRNVLLLRPASAETAFPTLTGRAAMAGNFEMVAPVDPAGEVSIAPALRVLPTGQYSLNVQKDGSQADASARPGTQPLMWKDGQKTAAVRVGKPGLYRIRVLDQTYVPRMEIEVLATSAASAATEAAGLKAAREKILGWNRTHGGWSLDDFLRVYLQARETAILAATS
jgi:hypothetical protein